MNRKLRMGMIGGGKNAFIGAVHRIAANRGGLIERVCRAFSSQPDNARESGLALFLPEDRVYSSFEEMMEKESPPPAEKRMDFFTIVTPNHALFAPAMLALEKGFHVVIEKPMTFSLDEARKLQKKVADTGLLLCLTHTYAGYPMVKQARQMVKKGVFGKIRKIYVEYPQGWLSRLSEQEGTTQAALPTHPSRSAKSGCMGDIGTHAAHLAEYISGLQIKQLCADLSIMVEGRALDDDGNVFLRFANVSTGT